MIFQWPKTPSIQHSTCSFSWCNATSKEKDKGFWMEKTRQKAEKTNGSSASAGSSGGVQGGAGSSTSAGSGERIVPKGGEDWITTSIKRAVAKSFTKRRSGKLGSWIEWMNDRMLAFTESPIDGLLCERHVNHHSANWPRVHTIAKLHG